MNEQILFVDDDPNILEAYQRRLGRVMRVETAEGGQEGLRVMAEKGPFAVVVSDMRMPGMDGIEFLARVKEEAPDTVRMMLTGNADIQVAMHAVNEGNIFRFLTKPCPSEVLGQALVAGINQYRLITAEKELLEGTLNGAVELLAEILSWVNPEAFGRTVQLRGCVKAIAAQLKDIDLWEVELAATLSQIGYMAVPQELLVRAYAGEPLTEKEQGAFASVPATAQELIAQIPRLESVARIVLYQNTHYDGSGFPEDGVSGDNIPLGARILKVVLDMLDIESGGVAKKEALTMMRKRDGWYDPRVLHAALELYSGGVSLLTVEEPPTILLQLSDLRPGLTLVGNIETLNGHLLLRGGGVLTEALLVRVKKFATLLSIKEPIAVRMPHR
jgi:response regulator RpfG family c-di-GMP phosphodiesterase